jgi:hypothetical protein
MALVLPDAVLSLLYVANCRTSFDFEHSLRQRPAGTIARFRPFHVQARYKQSRPTMSEETASVASVAAESLATISSEPTATIDSPRDPLSARSPPLQTAVESRPIVSALPVSALGDTNTRAVVNPPAIDPSPADDLAQWKQLASNYSTDVFDSDDDEEDDDARTSTTGSPSLPSASRPASRGTNSTYANNSVMHSTNSETSSSGGSSATSPSTTGHTTPMDTHASHPRVTAQLSHEEAVSRSHDYARAAQWDTLANSMTADGYVRLWLLSPHLTRLCAGTPRRRTQVKTRLLQPRPQKLYQCWSVLPLHAKLLLSRTCMLTNSQHWNKMAATALFADIFRRADKNVIPYIQFPLESALLTLMYLPGR